LRPKFELLNRELVERILQEALDLLMLPGVKVGTAEARDLLAAAGARVEHDTAHIPQALVQRALQSTPHEFFLYDRRGRPVIHYGGDHVHFDPGSSCLNVLDPETWQARPAESADLIKLVQVVEILPQYAAQSTAMVCNDVPAQIGDWYRLLLVLLFSDKPVVTGAFSATTLGTMLALLAADSGGVDSLRKTPRAVFDVCPSPPLNWSDFAAHNLVTLARAEVPAEMVSMPLAGATAPVTLAGSVVQHAAECLSGITIHQLARPGAPIVWGGAPAIFDMSAGTAPVGAIETVMLDVACAQVGKFLGLPTHAYLSATDSKLLDVQAGMESGISAVLGALMGINMISGAGMLDLLACHSVEKLVMDAEAIGYAQRLLRGIEARTETLALDMFAEAGLRGEFLRLKTTRALFRQEQHFPSTVIDRGGTPPGEEKQPDILARARQRVEELVRSYQRPEIPVEARSALLDIARRESAHTGLATLPGLATLQRIAAN